MEERGFLVIKVKRPRQFKGLTQEAPAAKARLTKDTLTENDLKILRKLLGQAEYLMQIKK